VNSPSFCFETGEGWGKEKSPAHRTGVPTGKEKRTKTCGKNGDSPLTFLLKREEKRPTCTIRTVWEKKEEGKWRKGIVNRFCKHHLLREGKEEQMPMGASQNKEKRKKGEKRKPC